jgi:GT2 family glycosyltransferase
MERSNLELAKSLKNWAVQCQPINQGDALTIAGLDRSNKSRALESLFFTDDQGLISGSGEGPIDFTSFERLNTGTFQNSFYPEIFRRHTSYERFRLRLEVTGSFALEMSSATQGQPVTTLEEQVFSRTGALADEEEAEETYEIKVDVPMNLGVPKNARLFWNLTALEDGARLHRGEWEALAPKNALGRMVVLLRTFGRTADILALLQSVQETASSDSSYARMLRNTFFLILDTSTGVEATDYGSMEQYGHINSFVFRGPNLGGGGNMSQALMVLEDAVEKTGVDVGELLLLDDDLHLSLESLRRHWASTIFRSDSTMFTLPVFMKTQPKRIWEDGAFWGRFTGSKTSAGRDSIAPRLLRHNLVFEGYNHLDEMSRAHYPEYCTFIFLSLPYSRFRELGYPVAFFLRGDDIEYSLRNHKAGGRTMSNPNLSAWHEPAHSYAQEYMSIAHGMIINMAYGEETADNFLSFFQERAVAHLSVADPLGLTLYAEVLKDLLECKVFLELGFAEHYVKKLKFFKAFDAHYEYIPDDVLNEFSVRAEGAAKTAARHGFLYMPLEGRRDLGWVILENPHNESHWAYLPHDADNRVRVTRAAADLFSQIDRLERDFEKISTHYRSRLEATSQREFWDKELSDGTETETLHPLNSDLQRARA